MARPSGGLFVNPAADRNKVVVALPHMSVTHQAKIPGTACDQMLKEPATKQLNELNVATRWGRLYKHA